MSPAEVAGVVFGLVALFAGVEYLEIRERRLRRATDPRRKYRDALRGAALRLDVSAGGLRLADDIVARETAITERIVEGQFARMAEDAAAAAAVCRQIALE